MAFTYDPHRRVAVDSESNSTLERTSKFTDDARIIVYRFTTRDLVVEFPVLPIDEQRSYQWKGNERLGWVHVSTSIVEPRLRESYFRQMKSRNGFVANEEAYRKFRNAVERAVLVLDTEGGKQMERVPQFRVRFVQGYDELKKTS